MSEKKAEVKKDTDDSESSYDEKTVQVLQRFRELNVNLQDTKRKLRKLFDFPKDY